jgi:hypothetical protein
MVSAPEKLLLFARVIHISRMLLTVLAAEAICDSSKEVLKEALKFKGAGRDKKGHENFI